MSNNIVYRKNTGRPLKSAEVDSNFKYIEDELRRVKLQDRFLFDNGYTRAQNTITIEAGSRWIMASEELTNTVDFVFAVPKATHGQFRVDVIVATPAGEFEIVQGEESEQGFMMPLLVSSVLPYLYLYISDTGIQNASSDASGDFVSKLSTRWTQIDLRAKTISINANQRNFEIIGGNQLVNGVMNALHGFDFESDFPDGFEVSVRNLRTDYMTIVHSGETINPLKIYTLENYFLRPGETIVFRYVKRESCFAVSGGLDVRLSWENVDEIIGTDSLTLFIESSAGDLLMADDLNTTLTPSVERYFKDYTDQVVQWQWFRESGTTQEDKDADEIWAMDKTSQILELQTDDFTHNIHTQAVTFVCQAIVNNQKITQKITI